MTGGIDYQNLMMWITKAFVILCCFPVHESAHAYIAYRLGDPTGKRAGRISLNPFRHLDPLGTLSILFLGVGFAKPVPVNIRNFKNRKLGFAATALAGPLSNLIMAALLLVAARFALPRAVFYGTNDAFFFQALINAAYLNVSLAVFNLIPIPPLDGSRIATAILPDRMYYGLMKYERYSMFALLAALLLFNRWGYSPVTIVSQKLFQSLYSLIL